MSKRASNRGKILMDGFQLRLMAVYIVHFMAILLVFVGMLFVPLMTRINNESLSVLEEQEAANQLLVLHTQLWPAVGMVFMLLVLHSLVVSHRIAGPLQRFRSTLKSISEGDLTRSISFRKNDYLGHAGDDVNSVIKSFATRLKDLRGKYRAVQVAYADLDRSMREQRQDVTEKQQQLGARMGAVEQWLGHFQLPPEDDERVDSPVDESSVRATEEVGA